MTPPRTRTVLVLGATGGIGGETAAALQRHGWHVRALSRSGQRAEDQAAGDQDWQWIRGDAMDRSAVIQAAEGAEAIVHAVNPSGYRNWGSLVLPMIDNTLAAAKASRARILLPGTIYNYGPDAFPVLAEDSPQRSQAPKGRIRIELEQRLEHAATDGVSSLIVRFGDFFGPRPGNNWFSQGLITPGKPVKRISYPGIEGLGHDWTYLPDAAEVFARLMDRERELPTFARFHFEGHWDHDGTQLTGAVRRAVGRPDVPIRTFPWWALRLAAPFNETIRELAAVKPLWREPIRLDNTRLVEFLGPEPHTELNEAVEATLHGLGCLPGPVPDAREAA